MTAAQGDTVRHMMPSDWNGARRMYERGDSCGAIAKRFATSPGAIRIVAARDGWAKPVAVRSDSATSLRTRVGRRNREESIDDTPGSPLFDQRMVRPKVHDDERRETIRTNLIRARITAGLSAVQAAQALGYANSTQLSLIESGKRKVPDGVAFLTDAARAYAVSVDFLLGLSPCMEADGKVLRERAMLREMESISHGIAATLASALVEQSSRSYPLMREYERLLEKVERARAALQVMRDRHGFDDAPGGAPLALAIAEMDETARPLRAKLQKFCAIEVALENLKAGRAIMPDHLAICCDEVEVGCDLSTAEQT